MRVRVGHTPEDRMIIEQSREPTDICTHREDQQEERKRNGEPAPRRCDVAAAAPGERTGSARDQDEENGKYTGNHG